MAYRLVEHTADLGFEAFAPSLDELFGECLKALTDCMTRLAAVGSSHGRRVAVEASDLGQLLVKWLTEAIYLHETAGLVLSEASVRVGESAGHWRLTGEVRGEPFNPERHGLKTLIKAVTYHRLEIGRYRAGWRAHVILDI